MLLIALLLVAPCAALLPLYDSGNGDLVWPRDPGLALTETAPNVVFLYPRRGAVVRFSVTSRRRFEIGPVTGCPVYLNSVLANITAFTRYAPGTYSFRILSRCDPRTAAAAVFFRHDLPLLPPLTPVSTRAASTGSTPARPWMFMDVLTSVSTTPNSAFSSSSSPVPVTVSIGSSTLSSVALTNTSQQPTDTSLRSTTWGLVGTSLRSSPVSTVASSVLLFTRGRNLSRGRGIWGSLRSTASASTAASVSATLTASPSTVSHTSGPTTALPSLPPAPSSLSVRSLFSLRNLGLTTPASDILCAPCPPVKASSNHLPGLVIFLTCLILLLLVIIFFLAMHLHMERHPRVLRRRPEAPAGTELLPLRTRTL